MRQSRSIVSFLMVVTLALSTACLTLFPETQEPYPTEDWVQPVRGPLKFDPQSLPDAQVGVPYEVEIRVSENVTPVGDFSVEPNTLPPGLELAIVEEVEDTARITGIPEEPGTYTFTISAWCYGTNVSGQTGEKEYTIVVE
ncbi:MAG: Ig domain-containing protein, partial [Chloroflexota bacterium]